MSTRATPESRLFYDEELVPAQSHRVADGTALVYSARCPGKDSPNEDAAAIIRFDESSGILAVADGLGGVRAGDQASNLALESLRIAVDEARRDAVMLRTAIINGLERANLAVIELGVGAATTIVVLEVRPSEVRPYHVGDSMVLVVGQKGKIKLETVSHSPVGFAVAAGMLDATEAMHHEDRHLVSNVIGIPEMRIEIGPAQKLAPRDSVLLASDGLFDNLHVEEIVERLRRGPLDRVAERLSTTAHERMDHPAKGEPSKPDDLTFVVYRPAVA